MTKHISQLGPLEQKVMNIVWQRQSVTVREVVTVLQQRRTIAYTTVMTIMSRLVKKGFLRQVKDGKVNIFSPKKNQQQTLQSLVKNTLRGFVDRFGEEAVAAFLDEAGSLTKNSKVYPSLKPQRAGKKSNEAVG